MIKLFSLLCLGLLGSFQGVAFACPAPVPQESHVNPKDKGITGTFVVKAEDGLSIRVAEYLPHGDAHTPLLVLFHDSALNRAEYRYLAPRFNRMGFNCLAPDLRAGRSSLGHKNGSYTLAKRGNRKRTVIDARQDMEAVLHYARNAYPEAPIIVMGCSYSGALSLRLAGEMAVYVDGVVAFSPAEIFAAHGQSTTWIEEGMPDVHCPVLILSGASEKKDWIGMYNALPEGRKHAFAPQGGVHGVRALAAKETKNKACWEALTSFLDRYYPRSTQAASQDQPKPQAEGEQAQPVVGDKQVSLERMVVIGASVSMGFFLPASLAVMLDSSCLAPHGKVRGMANGGFAWDSVSVARKQAAFARELKPSLLVAVDYLFWLGYGSLNSRGAILTEEAERLELLELGLELLEGFDCPLILGDFPNMSHAAGEGRMIAARQLPTPKTLALLNQRLAQWAAERGRVMIVPLREMQQQMMSGESFRVGNYRWPAGGAARVLQGDQLHPTLEGLAMMLHRMTLDMVHMGWSRPDQWELDLGRVLAAFDRSLDGVQALPAGFTDE